jgi:hypothetical protein
MSAPRLSKPVEPDAPNVGQYIVKKGYSCMVMKIIFKIIFIQILLSGCAANNPTATIDVIKRNIADTKIHKATDTGISTKTATPIFAATSSSAPSMTLFLTNTAIRTYDISDIIEISDDLQIKLRDYESEYAKVIWTVNPSYVEVTIDCKKDGRICLVIETDYVIGEKDYLEFKSMVNIDAYADTGEKGIGEYFIELGNKPTGNVGYYVRIFSFANKPDSYYLRISDIEVKIDEPRYVPWISIDLSNQYK